MRGAGQDFGEVGGWRAEGMAREMRSGGRAQF